VTDSEPTGAPDDRRRDLLARDAAAVWHPFTQHARWLEDDPVVVDRAEGMYLWDVDGRRYLDGNASLWVNVHGHAVPELDDAIRRQLGRLDHTTYLGMTHEPGIELAERLVRSAPSGLTKAFFAGDGASAVEAALKMAFQAAAQRGQLRPRYVHVAEGYHGDTLGAVSVGGIDVFHATYRPILLDTVAVSSPGVLADGQSRADRARDVVAELRRVLEREGEQVCAVIVEPLVQGAGGMLTHDGSFLTGVRALCDEFGAFMIADEVATGVGRTGRMWAVEHVDVAPDLLTCGKGVTAGYLPLSAVLATDEVYEAFLGAPREAKTFFHGHSYTANPLCSAVANANLALMDERGTVAHAAKVGELMGEWLAPLEEYDGVKEIRRVGTMVGIEVHAVDGLERTGFEVCRRMRELGVMTRPLDDVVVLMPPLAIGVHDLGVLVDVATQAVREIVL
jgi:adenosylmethionine-8-amino-7-oxononanoate aminotransferase